MKKSIKSPVLITMSALFFNFLNTQPGVNCDKIIDRKDILNLLWGNDSFFNSRNLNVYITKLCSYLKEDPSLEIITIKEIGYRFVTG